MATYFHGGGPEMQPDGGLQTLYLMNPSYVTGYSDAGPAAQQANMIFLNSPITSLNSIPQHQHHHHHHQQQQQQQHFVGIPLQQQTHSSLWSPAPSSSNNNNNNSSSNASMLMSPAQQQGLSLSLYRAEQEITTSATHDEVKNNIVGSSSSSPSGMQSVLMGSKYLKAAQQLLDEVVNVGSDMKTTTTPKGNDSSAKKSSKDLEGDAADDNNGKKVAAELSSAERQELQMKKAKLVNMLDEVEQRYRQYHHQMQIVVSSFEAMAGFGSARTYTALALQTISKQFRCLRDAITGQIRAASKSLGEEDCGMAGGGKSVGSRLRFVDHQLRQQRALQQLGMIQHNAWRPQRGLPERAVSVLRAWLFEHFLHPYPKDSDKHMLAKQTGLTRSQVSNWFINARVRLWKPMVEEMYMEETKEQERNNGGKDKASYSEGNSDQSASKSASQQANSTPSRAEQNESNLNEPKPPQMAVHSSDLGLFEESMMQQRLKKARSSESLRQSTMPNQMSMEMKPDELTNRELLMKFMGPGAGFGGYPMGEIGRFDHEQFTPRYGGNGVSLTLGLPHCETLSLSGSQQQGYLSNESIPLGRRLELGSEEHNYFSSLNNGGNNNNNNNGNNHQSAAHPPNAYESINMQNRKRFAAAQLLPDFVT